MIKGLLRGSENVHSLESRNIVRPRGAASVLKSTLKLTLVKMFGSSDRQDSDIQRRIRDDIMAELSRDGQPVEDHCLNMFKDVAAAQASKYASQRARVETGGR